MTWSLASGWGEFLRAGHLDGVSELHDLRRFVGHAHRLLFTDKPRVLSVTRSVSRVRSLRIRTVRLRNPAAGHVPRSHVPCLLQIQQAVHLHPCALAAL